MEPTQSPATDETPIIFLDMDGVLCDFVGSALEVLFQSDVTSERPAVVMKAWREKYLGEWDICKVAGCDAEDMWRAIHQQGASFWSYMLDTPLCLRLMSLSRVIEGSAAARVMVATSPSRHESSYAGKFKWLDSRRINAHSHAMLGSQKHLLAAPGRILVDDNDTNCERFRRHGGQAVLVPQVWNSLHAIAAQGEQAQWEYVEREINSALEVATSLIEKARAA